MATIGLITDQIYRLYNNLKPNDDSVLRSGDIKLLIQQVVSAQIKAEYFSEALPENVETPVGTMLSEYDAVSVTSYKSVSRAELPAIPISLPRNIGVFHVSDTNTMYDQIMPFQTSQWSLIKDIEPYKSIIDTVVYEVVGNYIVFNQPLGVAPTRVYLRLLIKDIYSLDEYDSLPIPDEMIGSVVGGVLEMLGFTKNQIETAMDSNNQQ